MTAPSFARWSSIAPSRSDSPAIRIVAGRPYQLVLAPVRAPEVIAWVAMGFVIDDKLAADMAQLVGVEVSFVGTAAGVPVFLASSMDAAQRSELNDSGTATTDRIFVAARRTMSTSAWSSPCRRRRGALQLVLAQLDRRGPATVRGAASRDPRDRRQRSCSSR